jgi:hypothetical protein
MWRFLMLTADRVQNMFTFLLDINIFYHCRTLHCWVWLNKIGILKKISTTQRKTQNGRPLHLNAVSSKTELSMLGNSRNQTHKYLRGSATCLLHRATGFVLIKLETIQTTKQGGRENLLYSTQALSLSRFSLCVFILLCHSSHSM